MWLEDSVAVLRVFLWLEQLSVNRTRRQFSNSLDIRHRSLSHCGLTRNFISFFGPVLYATPGILLGTPHFRWFLPKFLNMMIAGSMRPFRLPDNRTTIFEPLAQEATSAHLASSLCLNYSAFSESIFKIKWVFSASQRRLHLVFLIGIVDASFLNKILSLFWSSRFS